MNDIPALVLQCLFIKCIQNVQILNDIDRERYKQRQKDQINDVLALILAYLIIMFEDHVSDWVEI